VQLCQPNPCMDRAALCCAGSLVRAVLLATADAQDTAEPQHWEDGPHTATSTDTVEEWDVINLTGDGECVAPDSCRFGPATDSKQLRSSTKHGRRQSGLAAGLWQLCICSQLADALMVCCCVC
jgi:hypothetical protein